jgi:hypothetical protein
VKERGFGTQAIAVGQLMCRDQHTLGAVDQLLEADEVLGF